MVTKKKHAVFRVPNYGAKNRKGVKKRWRKPRGIDSKIRVEKKGHGATPKVGYKNHSSVRFARKDGTFEHLVHNERELLAIAGTRPRSRCWRTGSPGGPGRRSRRPRRAKGIRIVNRKKEQASRGQGEEGGSGEASAGRRSRRVEAKHEHEHAHAACDEHGSRSRRAGSRQTW